MNHLRDQGQKTIGFKLFGHIARSSDEGELITDLNKAFEIQFFPGSIPFGTVANLGRHDEKKIVVELPEEIKQNSFEKTCSFLLEKNAQLVVKEEGYEKLGNRKLQLEFYSELEESTVNVVIFIQGKCKSTNYEIELNPYDLSCSIGEIQHAKKYIKANLLMKELIEIKENDVSKVLIKLKPNNFHVFVDGDCLSIDLSPPLQQYIDSLSKPSKYQSQKMESRYLFDAYPDEIVQEIPEENAPSDCEPIPSKPSMWPNFRKLLGKR